jgi:hypothetical protein
VYIPETCIASAFISTWKDKLDGLALMSHKNQSCVSVKSNSSKGYGAFYISAQGLVGSERIVT